MHFLKLLAFQLVLVALLSDNADGWRRRRRRRCSPVNCNVNTWSYSACNCVQKSRTRSRTKIQTENSCGTCNYLLSNSEYCCCPEDCVKSVWGPWSTCTKSCVGGLHSRSRSIAQKETCGGTCSSDNTQSESCGTSCCSVDCIVNNWGSWTGDCQCTSPITQYRYRSISRQASCGGASCPADLSESQSKTCPCCAEKCQWTYGSWGACSRSCGTGTKTRPVVVTQPASCGGSACPTKGDSTPCTSYVDRDCQLSSWSSYGSCKPNSGQCGSGQKTRYRTVLVSKLCRGANCGVMQESVSCWAGCCPVNCVVTAWGNWGSCSTACGSGLKKRPRSITTNPSCGGSSCPSLQESTACSQYLRRDCSVDNWSAWTQCSTQCGTGTVTRSRKVIVSAACGGSCVTLSETNACTSYAANRDCKVGNWGNWGSCSDNCAVGKSYRYRTVTQSQNCKGAACPSLSDAKTCGSANGGCHHNCNNGACSCNAGYLLNSDKQNCRLNDCGQPSVQYCPSGTKLGTTCQYPTFTCSSGTTYTKTCSVQCPNGYELKNGPSSLTCQSSGAWTTYQSSYCSRINKPPNKITLSNSNVNENVGVGFVVGTFTTTDPNTKDTHTYQLVDNASGKFKLSGSSLLVSASLDYETLPNSFKIKVRSTDNKGLYLDALFTVSVTNVNEIPTAVTLSNTYVNENSGKGTVVGSFGTSDPDSSQTHTYSLLSNAGGRLSVNGNKLQVAVANTRCLAEGGSQCVLNYEGTKSYSVKVRSQDNGSPPLHKDVDFTIQLRDVNDQPRGIQLSGYKIKEDAAVGTSIGVLSASDEDPSQSLIFTLSDDAGGRFAILSGNKLTRKVASGIDYETTKSYKVTAVATDNGKPAKSISKQFTIEILNVNEPPVIITFSSSGGQLSFSDNSPSVNENSVKGTTVGTLSAFDADATQKLTFRLDDSAGGRFALKTSLLTCTSVNVNNLKTKCTVPVTVNGVLNHEVDALHTIVVRVTDEHKLFKTARYSIKIVDVNDRPRDITFSGGAQPSVKENLNGATLGSFKTTDDDPTHVHTYSLTNSAGGRFTLKGNALMTSSSANLNYEVQSQYTIVVRSTDSGSPPLYVEKTFTVQVVDVNEAPTAITLKNDKIAENSAKDSVVGTLSTVDPDNRNTTLQSFTYTLLDSAQGRFKIDKGLVKVALSNARCLAFGGAECKINYEVAKSHKLVVRTTDNGSPSLVKDFTVTVYVTDVNDQPRNLAIDNFSVKENAPADTPVGTLSASDEDTSQVLSYQLTDSDKGQFKLKGSQLLKAKPTNYETKTSHSITVVVTDSGSPKKSMTKIFTIEVLNVNEPPLTVNFKDTGGQLGFPDDLPRVKENSALKTVVGTVEGHDEDAGQTLTFSLDDDAGGLFQVATGKGVVCSSTNSIPGVKTVCTALVTVVDAINFEGSGKHNIIVRATDKGGLFKAVRFTVAVVDVNDKPTDIQFAGGSPQVIENKNGAIVGGLVTTDDDTTQSHTYKLVNDAGGRFVVSGAQIKVSSSANLDYETASQHTITVTSTDSGSPPLSVTKTFVVKVLDVNERPSSVSISKGLVAENSGANTAIGILSTVDPDNSNTLRQNFTYTMISDASGRFKVDGNAVKVASSNVRCLSLGGKDCVLNYEAQKQHTIVVRATDSGSPSMSIDSTLTIRLADINDRPRNLDLSNDRVFENEKAGTVVGIFSVNEEDVGQTITYSLTDDDSGRFRVVKNALQKVLSADYETAKSHTVTVLAKDNGNPSMSISKTFTIEVLDVNEVPIQINITDDDGQLSYVAGQPKVEEHSALGTVVGKLTAFDYDVNETLTFRLDDDADGRFSLGAVTCNAVTSQPGVHSMCWTTLIVSLDLNYEGSVNHYIEIRTTDTKGLFATRRFNVAIVDVNDVPHNVNLLGNEVNENLNNQLVGSFTTEDQDPSHNHTYTLMDDAGGRFLIKGRSLYTSPSANLDFETQSTYNVTVRSTDDGVPPAFREETFLITVRDVNEAPTLIFVSNLKIAENSPAYSGVGIVTVLDPDNLGPAGVWQTHNCTAIDNAEGRFIVESNSIKVAGSNLNYETNSSWSVVLRCVDSGSPQLYRDQKFVITILDVNERPTGIRMQKGSVEENLPSDQVAAIFATNDPDNEVSIRQIFNYTLEGQFNNFPFEIVGDELRTTRSLDFEVQPSWKVTVRSTDSGGLFITATFQVNVVNANDRPTGVRIAGASSVPENSIGGTYVGDLFAVDEDVKDMHIFTITAVYPGVGAIHFANESVPGLFQVNVSTGSLAVATGAPLDYEAVRQYTVEVMTTDSGTPSLSSTGSIIINITDVNEKPTNITLTNAKVDENSLNGTEVGRLTVFDPDNEKVNLQTHTCTVLNYVNKPFEVANNLKLVVSGDYVNFEQQRNYTIDIRCYDDGIPSMFIDRQFVVQVIDVNEAPVLVGLTDNTIAENLAVGSVVGIITSMDPDNEVSWTQNVTYSLDDNGNVPFAVNGSDLVTISVLDFEVKPSYIVSLTATDNGSPPLSTTRKIIIDVKNVNEQPTHVDLTSSGVAENSPGITEIGTLNTIDEDQEQNHTYAIVSVKNVTMPFYIDGNKLMVASGTRLDYEEENAFIVPIRTTDTGIPPLSYYNDVVVKVLNVNEPPTAIKSYSKDAINENSPAGTFVANFTVIDEDFNQTHTCRLLNGSDYFTLTGRTPSELFVADNARIDYEKEPTIWVFIKCTDDGHPPLSIDHSFAVHVIDVNEPVTDILLTGRRRIPENSPVGFVIGNLSVVDEDVGQTHFFSLVGASSGPFKINNQDRQLVVARPVRFDFERLDDPVINVTVMAVDDGRPSLSYTLNFSFTIINVNEPPVNVTVKEGVDILETATAGEIVGMMKSFNPEKDGPVTYTLLSVDGIANSLDFYVVTNSSGAFLYLNRSLHYDHESSFTLEIRAVDSGNPPASAVTTLTINVQRTDPCALGTAGCDSHATCSRTSPLTGECSCNTGYMGNGFRCDKIDHCRDTIIDPNSLSNSGVVNVSTISLCNHGECIDGTDNYTCSCLAGFMGSDCSQSVNECASNPCGEGGICQDLDNGFSCKKCSDGFRGDFCEENIDDCASSPCGVGTCQDGVATFQCTCPPEVKGDVCSFSATVCQRGDELCSQSQCVPVATNGAVVKTAPIEGLPGVAISTGAEIGENMDSDGNGGYMCIPDQDVVSLTFPSDLDVSGSVFQNQLERYLRDKLYVSVPDPDSSGDKIKSRISSVYIVKEMDLGDANKQVQFVVLINNEPVSKYTVLTGLKNECDKGSLTSEFGSDNGSLTCDSIHINGTSAPPLWVPFGNDPKPGKTDLIWQIGVAVSCFVVITLAIVLTLAYVRKRQKTQRFEMAREAFPWNPENDTVHGEYTPDGALARQNPIYEASGHDHDSIARHGIQNPMFDLPEDADVVESVGDGLTYTNPLYGISKGEDAPQNPVYEEVHNSAL